MPELPEVETMRLGVAAVQGGILADARTVASSLRPISIQPAIRTLRQRIVGRRVTAVERLGKRVVWCLDEGDALVFEPRMTGLLLVADPPDTRHLRLRLAIKSSPIQQVLFWDQRGLGRVYWLSAADRAARFNRDTIGPDAMQITGRQLRDRLADSRRAVKVALLDQRVLAGVGNLYASEILHQAKIHPALECRRLADRQWSTLIRALRSVLTAAIQYEGSTLSDGTYRNALNRQGDYQRYHRVYAKGGRRCVTCRQGTVIRIVQAQRSTYYCPICQPSRTRRP